MKAVVTPGYRDTPGHHADGVARKQSLGDAARVAEETEQSGPRC